MALQACHSGVAFYEFFDLALPKKSKVSRPTANTIKIDTDKLSILIDSRFKGINEVLPYGFEAFYLGIRNGYNGKEYLRGGNSLKVEINVDINLRLKAFLSRSGWEYYNWIDSFLSELEKEVSKDYFLKEIGWETISTYIICNINREKKLKDSSNALQTTLPGTIPQGTNNLKDKTKQPDSSYA